MILMAECVGCGKQIEPGKLFCDQCYAKMKGRRGPMRERVTPSPHTVEKKPAEREERPQEGPPAAEGVIPEEKATLSKEGERRRASDVLTPATHKKVVRLHPEVDKGREKAGKGEKRFAVTITLSERAYRLLSSLGRRSGKEAGAPGEREEGGEARPKTTRRLAGPHGRPALKAVAGREVAGTGRGSRGGFLGWVARRERPWDRGDYLSLALAAAATVMVLVLPFVSWVRMSWLDESGSPLEEVAIKGVQLGASTYILIFLGVAAAVYAAAAFLAGEKLRRVDAGFVYLALGMVFIIVFYVGISSNERMVSIALRVLQDRGVTGYAGVPPSRNTLFSAYLMLLTGLFMSFSGLIRLSERRR